MTPPLNTPVVQALQLVANTNRANGDVLTGNPHIGMCRVSSGPCTCATRVLLASYRHDFKFLWSRTAPPGERPLADWLLAPRNNTERTIVVIDDRPAAPDPQEILVSDHTTPYDWAVTLSLWATASLWAEKSALDREPLKQEACPSRETIPPLRILLVTPEQSAATTSPSRLRFRAVAQCLPWVQGYGALGREHITLCALPADAESLAYLRSAVPIGTFGFKHLLEDVEDPRRVADLRSLVDDEPENAATALRAVAAAWLADLVKPETRHAVANCLAPALLAEALPETLRLSVTAASGDDRADRAALRRLAGLVGLHGGVVGTASVPTRGVISSGVKVPFSPEGPNFLLIDDQFDLGYAHLLGALLFGDRKIAIDQQDVFTLSTATSGGLRCLKHPAALLRALPTTAVPDWKAPRVLNWRGELAGVFLDLRLWAKPEEAGAVQRQVVDAAERLGACGAGDPRLASALKAVREEKPHSIEAMTLLPLLLSHYDASLPIVLFSSTHQRQVVEAVGHRHNIITTFSKPLLSGYGSAGEELQLLVAAIEEGHRLQAGRHLWARVAKLELPTGRPFPDSIEAVRRTLAEFVWHYVIDRRSYDFLSVPWEYLEARVGFPGVAPDHDRTERWEAMKEWAGDRKWLLYALRDVRNRKTHGVHWLREEARDAESLDEAGPILCGLLLDVLDGQLTPARRDTSLIERLADRAYRRAPGAFGSNRLAVPNRVVTDATIDWGVFCTLVFLSVLQRKVSLDEKTMIACQDYIDRRIDG